MVTYIASNLRFFSECKSLGLLQLWNIHSLLCKPAMDTSWECTANPNDFAVSKSWVKKSVTNSNILIPGYNIINQDRDTKGGGVVIL